MPFLHRSAECTERKVVKQSFKLPTHQHDPPPITGRLKAVAWNVQSIVNKQTEVLKHILDTDPDVVFVSETWLPDDKNDITATVKSYGYKLLHNHRKDREKITAGGVGIMLRNNIECKHLKGKQYSSFEHTMVKVKTSSNTKLTLITIYCLLFIPTSTFLEELSSLLEIFTANDETFIIAGDVNIHLDDVNDTYSKQFNEIMEMFSLSQHVTFPTHKLGHTLDAVITQVDSPIIENVEPKNVDLSDHYMVVFDAKTTHIERKEYIIVNFRNLKSIDNVKFCSDIKKAGTK